MELAPRRNAELRRCCGASPYCAANLRLSPAWTVAGRIGVAALAASSDDSVCGRLPVVGEWNRRIDPFVAGVAGVVLGHPPASTPMAQAGGCGIGTRLLRLESQPAVHADHSDDRAAVCLRDGVDGIVAGAVAREFGKRRHPAQQSNPVVAGGSASRGRVHPLRRMDHGTDRECSGWRPR